MTHQTTLNDMDGFFARQTLVDFIDHDKGNSKSVVVIELLDYIDLVSTAGDSVPSGPTSSAHGLFDDDNTSLSVGTGESGDMSTTSSLSFEDVADHQPTQLELMYPEQPNCVEAWREHMATFRLNLPLLGDGWDEEYNEAANDKDYVPSDDLAIDYGSRPVTRAQTK